MRAVKANLEALTAIITAEAESLQTGFTLER